MFCCDIIFAQKFQGAFKFNCSTEFGSLELIVCFHEVNDDTDIQHVLSLNFFEVNLGLNDFRFF